MKIALPLCIPLLLTVLGACSSTGPTYVPRTVAEPGTAMDRPLTEDEARRLFLEEERVRRGVRLPVDPPPTRIERRPPAEPSTAPEPGRITHAEAYRRSKQQPGFQAEGTEVTAAAEEKVEEAGEHVRPFQLDESRETLANRRAFAPRSTSAELTRDGDSGGADLPPFLQSTADRGRAAAARRGLSLPGPGDDTGQGITARPGVRFDALPPAGTQGSSGSGGGTEQPRVN